MADMDDSESREDAINLRGAGLLVEVFAADNDITASVAIDEVLAPAGIEAVRHDRRMHALPAPAAEMGTIGVAVPAGHADQARTLLREALADGVLLDGRLADETALA